MAISSISWGHALYAVLVLGLELVIASQCSLILASVEAPIALRRGLNGCFWIAFGYEIYSMVLTTLRGDALEVGSVQLPLGSAARRTSWSASQHVPGSAHDGACMVDRTGSARAAHMHSAVFSPSGESMPPSREMVSPDYPLLAAAPCPEVLRLLGEAPWVMRFEALPGQVTTHKVVETMLDHPFARVLHCLQVHVMFSSPRRPQRSAADAVQADVLNVARVRARSVRVQLPVSPSPAARQRGGMPSLNSASLHLLQERVCMRLPAVVTQVTGERSLELHVDSETQGTGGEVALRHFAWTRNATLRSVGAFQEWALYRPDPAAPHARTQYLSVIQVCSATWLGRRVIGLVGGTGQGIISQHVSLMRARLEELRVADERAQSGVRASGG